MVTIVKPNGKLRICIDPRDLNGAVKRDYYPMTTIEKLLQECRMLKCSQSSWMLVLVSGKSS